MTPTDSALMAWHAAHELVDGEVAFVGIGAPGLAAMIARRHHAPGLAMVFESGVMGADPDVLPLSTGSPSVARNAAMHGSMLDVFADLQQGRIDVGLLSGAEVDRRGNLNSTVIGPYAAPKVRLPGSGGAHDIAVLARRVVILMPHDVRRFVRRVDFITSPGHNPGRTYDAGDVRREGPVAVVTSRAVFRFARGELTLAALAAGTTAAEALHGFAWPIPSRRELSILPPFPGDASTRFPFLAGGGE